MLVVYIRVGPILIREVECVDDVIHLPQHLTCTFCDARNAPAWVHGLHGRGCSRDGAWMMFRLTNSDIKAFACSGPTPIHFWSRAGVARSFTRANNAAQPTCVARTGAVATGVAMAGKGRTGITAAAPAELRNSRRFMTNRWV